MFTRAATPLSVTSGLGWRTCNLSPRMLLFILQPIGSDFTEKALHHNPCGKAPLNGGKLFEEDRQQLCGDAVMRRWGDAELQAGFPRPSRCVVLTCSSSLAMSRKNAPDWWVKRVKNVDVEEKLWRMILMKKKKWDFEWQWNRLLRLGLLVKRKNNQRTACWWIRPESWGKMSRDPLWAGVMKTDVALSYTGRYNSIATMVVSPDGKVKVPGTR